MKEQIIDLVNMHFPNDKQIRPEQMEALIKCSEAYIGGKKHFIAELPTGVGKSLIAITFARMISQLDFIKNSKKPHQVIVSTKTKMLQDQYMSEFKDLAVLKGKSNYKCVTPAISPNTRKDLKLGDYECRIAVKDTSTRNECSVECPYIKAANKFMNSDIRIVNNALLMNCNICSVKANNFFERVKHGKPVENIKIIDECHQLQYDMIEASSLTLNLKEVSQLLDQMIELSIPHLDFSKALEDLVKVLSSIRGVKSLPKELTEFRRVMLSLVEDLNKSLSEGTLSKGGFGVFTKISDILLKVDTLDYTLQYVIYGESIYVEGDDYASEKEFSHNVLYIKPLSASAAYNILMASCDFVLHLSATVGDVTSYADEIGLPYGTYDFYRCDSPFKAENRKIYYKPCVKFTFANKDTAPAKVASVLDEIITSRPNERLLVHVSAYQQAHSIKENSKNEYSIVIPKNSEEVSKFIDTGAPMIGPTLYEGIDFKDERCRINVLAKVQFPNLGDFYTECKMKYVQGWYERETLMKFIQAYGRGVRHKDDYAEFIILDESFGRLRNSKHIPMWIKNAFVN